MKNFPVKPSGDFTDDDLRALFEEHGEIASVAIKRDDDGKSKGFGFVCFKEWQSAHKALMAYEDGKGKDGSSLYVSEFKTKEQRQKELQLKTYQFKKSMVKLNLVIKNLDSSATED